MRQVTARGGEPLLGRARGIGEGGHLLVRGSRDIVGLERDAAWTPYACHTAAEFLMALIRSGVIDPGS